VLSVENRHMVYDLLAALTVLKVLRLQLMILLCVCLFRVLPERFDLACVGPVRIKNIACLLHMRYNF
jgi:hypothetical protein